MSRALELVQVQVSAGKTRQQVAIEIGYSRTAVSLYLKGTYGGVDKIEPAILKAYDRHDCPHTGGEISPELCRSKALAHKPFGGYERRVWWICCQTCPHKPEAPK